MNFLSELQKRNIIVDYHTGNPGKTKYQVWKYFSELGVAKQTIYDVLNRHESLGSVERTLGSGRLAKKMKKKQKALLITETVEKGKSQNQTASKFRISQSYVCRILRKSGLRAYKKQKVPLVSNGQKEVQKVRCKKLHKLIISHNNPDVIMDDETYFTLKNDKIPNNSFYYATCSGDAPVKQRTSAHRKFEQKLMMWIAISPKGISKPFFFKSGEAVHQKTYSQCIEKCLVPFIHQKYTNTPYIFWPDLASSHTAKSTLDLFKRHALNVVPKDCNPPNAPQIRAIEDFFGILKQTVYSNNWTANDHKQLKRRIKYCLEKKIDSEKICDMMKNVCKKVKKAKNYGLQSLNH